MSLASCLPLLFQLAASSAPVSRSIVPAAAVSTRPVLALPEVGLDDTAAYQGYQTRFFRDAAQNSMQIYVDRRAGRVVQLWADAENESIGFTARTATGTSAPLKWADNSAVIGYGSTKRTRTLEYRLLADVDVIHVGWFLLGTMRLERDFQYFDLARKAFSNAPYRMEETGRLLSALGKLSEPDLKALLPLLNAPDLVTLEARRAPSITVTAATSRWTATITQPSLDGRDTITLALSVDPRTVGAVRGGDSLTFSARQGHQIPLSVRVTTTGAPLTPLPRTEIFTADFLRFLQQTRAASTDSLSLAGQRARRLERQARGVELLSSREKLMAGLPTYATYFGRDMLVSALMMRPIWRSAMSEAAISAALRKLAIDGQVSHEEALGGQAVREAAAEFAELVDARIAATKRGDRATADSLLRVATSVLRNARKTRENYHMIDDELQLPVLVARWITDPSVPRATKRAFLTGEGQRPTGGAGVSRLALLVRELALVARMTSAYAEKPDALNLVGFARRDGTGDATRWSSLSWRDSGVGYANGRYAMDVNAIWAPQALESMQRILTETKALGFSIDSIAKLEPTVTATTTFIRWAHDSAALNSAITTWRGASAHFVVQRSPAQLQSAITARLDSMPSDERRYWTARVAATHSDRDSLSFLALALDATGAPIAVANTDPATRLFLGEREGTPTSLAQRDIARALRDVRVFTRPYPAGLLVDGIGPAVANDAYAPPRVWDAFVKDAYHGPRVIWGREVNLFLLGAADRVRVAESSRDASAAAYARELRAAIRTVRDAVNASGFHSELWSYGFTNGQLVPMRYGSGADVQLWSTTDLAVEYALSRMGAPPR